MPSNKAKNSSELNAKSTQALYDLLECVIKKPLDFIDNATLIKSLKSQGGTAKLSGNWNSCGKNIEKVNLSINTLKKYSNEMFLRGFDEIDELRKAACDQISAAKEKSNTSNKRTKTGLVKRVQELEEELLKHKKVNFTLLQKISVCMASINSVSNTVDPSLREKRAEDALKKIRAMASLNMPPFNKVSSESNIININEHINVDP